MKITIEAVKNARKEIEKINAEYDLTMKEIKKRENEIYTERRKRENILEKWLYNQRDKEFIKSKKAKEKQEKTGEKHHAILDQYESIMKNIDIIRESRLPEEPQVDISERGDDVLLSKPITVLQNNEYAFVGVYIVPNEKPKNKYSLVIVGDSIFREFREFKSYGLPCNCSTPSGYYCRIEIAIKDLPTKEELMKYDNNKTFKKIATRLYEVLNEKAKMYNFAKKLYESKEWKIAYLEYKKDYYENHYSRGIEQPEYKAICKELNQTKKAVQDGKYNYKNIYGK
jgi:hypothetical protein